MHRLCTGLCLAGAALAVAITGIKSATAAVSCSISAITASYGSVDILSGAIDDTTGTFTVTCSGGSASQSIRLCLEMGAGATALGPSNERVLRSASDYIDQEFYFDAARTQVWGAWGTTVTAYPVASPAGIQQDVTLNGSGNGTFNYTVYGRIFGSQQTKTPGSYTWTGSSPAVQYRATSGATACPTGGSTAASSGSTFSATINSNANVSTSGVNFGSVSFMTSNTDATGTVTVQATNTTPYNVGLGAGGGSGATVATRKMTNGANTVTYSLYSDVSRTTVWGNTIGSDTVTGTGSGNNQSLTVYGRAPVQSSKPPGTYTDTVVVTVTY